MRATRQVSWNDIAGVVWVIDLMGLYDDLTGLYGVFAGILVHLNWQFIGDMFVV